MIEYDDDDEWDDAPTAAPGKIPGIPIVGVTEYSRTTECTHHPLPSKMIVLMGPTGYWSKTFPAFDYCPPEKRFRI